MRVACVGGAGFVGHHLALRLAAEGAEPLVLDCLAVNHVCSLLESTDNRWGPLWARMAMERMALLRASNIPFIHCDARDYHMLSKHLREFHPDAIVHLAAVAHIDRANKDPATTFDHSLRTLENSLDAAKALNIGQFVYFSSSTAYGPFLTPVIDEKHSLNPVGVYGTLKACGEMLVRTYQDTYGLNCTIVRPQALYGPRCVSGRVIQKFIENAIDGKPIRIDGDGSACHDFTFVADLVEGVCLVLRKPEAWRETFNMTAGEAHSLAYLAELVQRAFPEAKVVHGPADPEKPSRGTMSSAKAIRLLGYQPQWPFERGVAAYCDWYKTFLQ